MARPIWQLNRREWLHSGGLGLMGLFLSNFLRAGKRTKATPLAKSCVLVLNGGPSQLDIWDMKPAAPVAVTPSEKNLCFSAFLEDLHPRGLLGSTLVLCMGEFGRTPRFGQFTGNGFDQTRRDHWASILVAGGKAGAGRVLGRSDSFAAYPADNPYTPQDLTARFCIRSVSIREIKSATDSAEWRR